VWVCGCVYKIEKFRTLSAPSEIASQFPPPLRSNQYFVPPDKERPGGLPVLPVSDFKVVHLGRKSGLSLAWSSHPWRATPSCSSRWTCPSSSRTLPGLSASRPRMTLSKPAPTVSPWVGAPTMSSCPRSTSSLPTARSAKRSVRSLQTPFAPRRRRPMASPVLERSLQVHRSCVKLNKNGIWLEFWLGEKVVHLLDKDQDCMIEWLSTVTGPTRPCSSWTSLQVQEYQDVGVEEKISSFF
jgi:hypothetical protein